MAENRPTLRDADLYDFNGLRDRLIDLAGMGHSPSYIAKVVGEPYEKVRKILKAYYEDRCAHREEIIQSLDQNLHWLQLKTAKVVEDGKGKLDVKVAELFLKIVDRRARLHGADKPQEHKVEISYEQLTHEEMVAQLNANGVQISFPTSQTPLPLPAPQPHIVDAEFEVVTERDAERTPSGDSLEGPQGQRPGVE